MRSTAMGREGDVCEVFHQENHQKQRELSDMARRK